MQYDEETPRRVKHFSKSITFNIKAIRIQNSKCSHPVKFPLGGIKSLRFINQWNLCIFKKTLVITLQKVILQKLLFKIFLVTTFNFSNITLRVIPSSSKCSVVLPLYCLPHVFVVVNLVNSSVIFMLYSPFLSLNKIQLRSHYVIFYFSSTSVRYRWRR